jgi:hypothetical protein
MRGVILNDRHTYRDWGLIMKARPKVSPPVPKTKLVEVPGSDTPIDLTEALTGAVHYEMRTISFEFVMMAGRARWTTIYADILKELHGKRVRIIMDDDPNYVYTGRMAVGDLEPDKSIATLTMEATVEPYKRERYGEGRCL